MNHFDKATYEDLDAERFKVLSKYLTLDLIELRNVKDYWAIGEHVDKLLDARLHPEWDAYQIIAVSPSAVIARAYCLELPTEQLFNNDINDFRFATTLERWEQGLVVDPPIYL